jgi:hypothetical protein
LITEKVNLEKIQDVLQKDGKLDDIKSFLNTNKVSYRTSNLWGGVEQIDEAASTVLQSLKPLSIKALVLPDQNSITVIELVNSYPDPAC